jgi:HK97 family phage major capsid protein
MALYTATGGPILSPEQVAALVVQPLIDQSVAAQVSTVITTTSHDLRVPIVTADPAAAWTAEGAEIGVSDPTLTELTVTPRKLAGLVVVSMSSPPTPARQHCRWSATDWSGICAARSTAPTSATP